MSPCERALSYINNLRLPLEKAKKKVYRKSESFDGDDYGSGTVCMRMGNIISLLGPEMHKDTT